MIYAIRMLGTEYIKIGLAKSPKKRLSELQVASPFDLRLVAYAPWPDREERAIHRWLAGQAVRGEWFQSGGRTDRIISLLRDHARGYEDWLMLTRR